MLLHPSGTYEKDQYLKDNRCKQRLNAYRDRLPDPRGRFGTDPARTRGAEVDGRC